MKREVLSTLALVAVLYQREETRGLCRYVPWWSLMTLGSYMLLSVGVSLCSFEDISAASVELRGEVAQAQAELGPKLR